MKASSATIVASLAAVAAVAASIVHLDQIATNTLTVYTTPALREVLEKDLIPRYRESGGLRVEPVYTTAGEQYNRLRMSGDAAEADLFMQASPLYLEKATKDGYFVTLNTTGAPEGMRGAPLGDGYAWRAFAWTPLVEVYSAGRAAPPDLYRDDLRVGLPHPRLSNNGLYCVVVLEELGEEIGQAIVDRTVVQPVNARTTVGGVVDRSFDAALGYEAVVKFYQGRGAKVAYGPPTIDGHLVSTAGLFAVSVVDGPRQAEAKRFADFLFTPASNRAMETYHFRSVDQGLRTEEVFPGKDVRFVGIDWAHAEAIEAALTKYEVGYRG